MEMQSIQARWKEQCRRLSSVTDGVGRPIDPGIFELVVAVNMLGLCTTSSCEGHIDHGSGAPYIDFEVEEVMPLRQQEERQVLGSRESFEIAARAVAITARAASPLCEALSHFYSSRAVAYDTQLTVVLEHFGTGTLGNQGAFLQYIRKKGEKERYLGAYQQEMAAFTAFLKAEWFGGVR